MRIHFFFFLDGLKAENDYSYFLPLLKSHKVEVHSYQERALEFINKCDQHRLGSEDIEVLKRLLTRGVFIEVTTELVRVESQSELASIVESAIEYICIGFSIFSQTLYLIRSHIVQIPYVLVKIESIEKSTHYKYPTYVNLRSVGSESDHTIVTNEDWEKALLLFEQLKLDEEEKYERGGLALRVLLLIQAARSTSVHAHGVASLVSALECLVIRSNEEIAHQFSERIAALVGSSLEDKFKIYTEAKKLYNARSDFFHGRTISDSPDLSKEQAETALQFIRSLIALDSESQLRFAFLFENLDDKHFRKKVMKYVFNGN